jgi:hypothetical protein
MASAPEASRAWLLIEHPGPWPHEAADAAQPAPLTALVRSAEEFGVRVHLIRRPGRRQAGDVRSVFLGWTAGDTPWLRCAQVSASAPELTERDLKELAAGIMPSFGVVWDDPLYLVCTHGKRNVCCARLGGPLAQALANRHPGPVWETTHVGGHRFAANLVILPHGLYYGPVGVGPAAAAIDAYQRGAVVVDRYRGRAGQARADQEAEYARLAEAGVLPLAFSAERVPGAGRGVDGGLGRGGFKGPGRADLGAEGLDELGDGCGRALVQGLGHDQDGAGGGRDRGPAALPVGPAAGVRLPGLVGEDHLAGGGVLDLAAEREVVLVAGRVPHLERPGDLVRVEDGDRDGEGQRDRVAQVDQRVQRRQAALGTEPAQQRFGRAAVLGRLQAHPGEGAPPGLDFGKL